MSEITNERREAMGWERRGYHFWHHRDFGPGSSWGPGAVDHILPIQEENARLKAELAELRKPEAPKEWAAGQVWRIAGDGPFLVMQALGRVLSTGAIDEKTGVLSYPSSGFGEVLGKPEPGDGEYLGQYEDLYGAES